MTDELVDDIEVVSPGQLLREAREKLGWTQQDVAGRLNLRAAVVEALESDQYDDSIGATFIRGYLRTYAKLLGISDELIMASYEHLGAAQIQYAEMQSFSRRTKREASDNRLMMLTYGIGVVLIVLSVIWYVQESEPQADPIASALEEQKADLAPIVIEPQQPVEQLKPQVADELLEPVEPAEAIPEQSPDAAAVAPEQEVIAPAPAEESLAGTKLTLTFTEDCWVSIEDATGERLAFGIKRKDYEMTLDGRPPYQLVLGAPEAVEIQYGGLPYTKPKFKPGQRARFTIPSQE
ncbi:RodZ domain-containing protein [Corallincola platygyrae]|uniref:RodZ domain-containing protein n=1 Tax=Corallincola platygyrae TaxID=1193278 RepID=A0ABW4XM09_9GAMM